METTKKISLLYLLNFISYLMITTTIIVLYYLFLKAYSIYFVLFIILIIFTNIFFYNHVFLWIISKSKNNSNIWKFFTTWGRIEIRNNINDYFEGKYIKIYRRIIFLSYIIFAFNIVLILSIPIYITFFYSV